MDEAHLRVISAGPLTTVQDLGRPGWAHLGVTGSGAADAGALALANRLVGNAENAPGLEVILGGFAAQAGGRPLLIAVTGARCPVTIGGRPCPSRALLDLGAGEVLALGAARHGLRCYVAVRGGLGVVPQLGSAATDLLGGLGPAPVADADVLPVSSRWIAGWPVTDLAPGPGDPQPGDVVQLIAMPGPREHVLGPPGLAGLAGQEWRTGQDSDRVGVRLLGRPLPLRSGSGVGTGSGAGSDAATVPSEPVVRGAVQLPPSGQPVLFLADHPVTGGYPVIAVLTRRSADAAAQLRPGDPVRIRLTGRPHWADPADPLSPADSLPVTQ